jgi:hypothetical protein
MTTPRNLLEDLLARGVDDWVYDAQLLDIAASHGVESAADRRTLAIGLVAEALIGGFMEAGTVSNDGFVRWACSADAAVQTVTSEWLSRHDPLVMPGEIVWLTNTARGSGVGERVLAREQG